MNKEIQNWKSNLEKVAEPLHKSTSIDFEKMLEIENAILSISDFLVEKGKELPKEELKEAQIKFRKDTNSIFEKSYFVKRIRNWPRGYPGDYETLEKFYHGTPSETEGVGLYFDNYIVTRTLAKGVRERKRTLGKILVSELQNRNPNQQILNIACGSSREIFDIGSAINEYKPKITFIDYDKNAVDYSKLLLHNEGINIAEYDFFKFNALDLVSADDTKLKFGEKDIIYSAGLFDYIKTDVLIKMIRSMYKLLGKNGVLIAPFKDKENYSIFDYHWLVDWSYFLQRTIEEVKTILEEATEAKIEIIKSGSPAINFFIIRK